MDGTYLQTRKLDEHLHRLGERLSRLRDLLSASSKTRQGGPSCRRLALQLGECEEAR
jgi:hypothetical protein